MSPRPRVGVDATSWEDRRGSGRFARNAIAHLVELDTETEYVLYVPAAVGESAALPAGASRRPVALRGSAEAAAGSSRHPIDLIRLTAAASRSGLDAFLFPSVLTFFPVFRVPTIVGLHDTIAHDLAELALPTRRARALWRAKHALAMRRATRLFTVSEASRTDLAARFGLRPDDLAVVPEAPDPVFRPRPPDEVARHVEQLGLHPGERFVLFAGGISPHKDVGTLLDAFAGLEAGDARPRLVIVGDLERSAYPSAVTAVRARIAALGIEADVVLPGFVSDDTLACLYSAAAAVVVPSLAEGFGLPAVEAAACGAPAILSDLPAHRETLGEAALFFPAGDAAGLRAQLERLLDDDSLRRAVAQRGRVAASRLTWDAAALRLRDVVAEAVRAAARHA